MLLTVNLRCYTIAMINVPHAVGQSLLLYGILTVGLVLSGRRRSKSDSLFPISVTTELKGLAILAIYFSHIWIFLVSDRRFLFPLAGVSQAGVDLFLILSGYGLSVSNLRRPQAILVFYKRLLKLFIPLWIVLTVLLTLDAVLLGIHYSGHLIILDYLGIYLTSSLGQDIDAPLWFITYIAGCYLLFPLVFRKHRLWLSALIIFIIGVALVIINPPILKHVIFLYAWHPAAFPAGMLLAWLFQKQPRFLGLAHRSKPVTRGVLIALLSISLIILNPQSHGASAAIITQAVDLAFAFVLIALFIIKPIELRLFSVLGAYSFEIYLLHWPIVLRYNYLYTHLPAWFATLLYLTIILALSYLLQRLTTLTKPQKREALNARPT